MLLLMEVFLSFSFILSSHSDQFTNRNDKRSRDYFIWKLNQDFPYTYPLLDLPPFSIATKSH